MLETKVLKISSEHPDSHSINEAAEVLKQGGLVAFPTETVYGLGADAFNERAIKKVFEAKGRPSENPLIVHIASLEQLQELSNSISPNAKLLAEAFWPGPLTLVLERSPAVTDLITAGLDTVAVRMPDHPVTLALIKALGKGIVGPSANISGSPSPTKAEHVYADLQGKIDLILDAGPTDIGVESTILDVTINPPLILRHGGLPQEKIEEVIGHVETTDDLHFLKRSPGTHHRHYAPNAAVILIDDNDVQHFKELINSYGTRNKRIGCIVHTKQLKTSQTKNCQVLVVESIQDLSRKLFDTFRLFDQQGVDVILVEAVPKKGIGAAIMDRIKRAASASVFAKEHIY